MAGKFIDIPAVDGGAFKAYLAAPSAKRAPGIVLIQEVFGVNNHIRSVADRYAADGYLVLAPDIFWRSQPMFDVGYDPESIAEGRAMKGQTDIAKAVVDVAATVSTLRAPTGARVPEEDTRLETKSPAAHGWRSGASRASL